MVDTNWGGGPGFAAENSPTRDGGERCHDNGSHYVPQPLIVQQREELRRRSEQALHTPITGNTLEEITLENACVANLAKREQLERLQQSLEARAARDQPSSSRTRPELFTNDHTRHIEMMRSPLLNLVVATQIVDSIQPSDTPAEEGIWQIQALLKTAL
ncbi:hypothetical protein D1007_53107 [Hordeum vulgare]|nr:hypothetical protein D1007_53107 [Hordeum vulgare]